MWPRDTSDTSDDTSKQMTSKQSLFFCLDFVLSFFLKKKKHSVLECSSRTDILELHSFDPIHFYPTFSETCLRVFSQMYMTSAVSEH